MVDHALRGQVRTLRPDGRVAILAARQNGLANADQLRAAGLTRRAIQWRVETGRLHVVHRGVYAVGHPVRTREARLHAAVLAVGVDAVLSHLSAAGLWGLIRPSGAAIEVCVARRVASRASIRVHLTRTLPEADVARCRSVPVTSPARTLADVAAVLPERALRRAVNEALVRNLIEPSALEAQLRAGRPGTRRLRAVIAAGPEPTRSGLEDEALDLLRRSGLPRPQVNARVRGDGATFEVDFLFAEQGLIVEVDGDRYHATRLARDRDAARQAALEAAGYRVIRLTPDQVGRATAQTVKRLRSSL